MVNAQFVETVMKLQSAFSRVPSIVGPITSGRESFDVVMSIIMNSGIAAIAIVAFVVPVLWLSIFRNWKARIMEMRRGRYFFDKRFVNPATASNFIGYQLWGFVASILFIVVLVLHPLFFIIGLLGHFPFILTDILWPRLRTVLLGLLSVEISIIVARQIARHFLVRDGNVVQQRLFSTYDYAFSVLSIVGGAVALVVTVIVSLFFFVFSLARLDIKRFTVEGLSLLFEPAYSAMCSAIMVDHDNTNPVKVFALDVFCRRLRRLRHLQLQESLDFTTDDIEVDIIESKRKSHQIRREIIQNRFHLWVMMSRNPSLSLLRKKRVLPCAGLVEAVAVGRVRQCSS